MDSEQKAEIKSDLLRKTEINSKFIYGGRWGLFRVFWDLSGIY